MILEDGEKYACEHCIRGHRVSSCSHTERPLHHINRKGRPLSQCQHCRGLRKSRAAHVKCECGDHSHARNGSLDKPQTNDDSNSNHATQCQCMSGKKCNCSIKKEHDESHKSDATAALHHRNLIKPPSIAGRRSESSVPRVRNGFHPPLHRNNHAAHESGMPYPHHRAPTGFRPFHQAQRSVDSLPLLTYGTTASQPQLAGLPSLSMPVISQEQANAGSPPLPNSSGTTEPRPAKVEIPTIDLSSAFDMSSFKNNALSPGNPQRYSINDFSMFMNDAGVNWDFNNPTPVSGNAEPMGFGWNEWGFPTVADQQAEQNDGDGKVTNAASAQTIYQFSGGPGVADMRHSSQPNLAHYSPGGSSSDQGYGSSVPPSQVPWPAAMNAVPNMNMPWAVASSDVKNELPSVGFGPSPSYQDSNASTLGASYTYEELFSRSLNAQKIRDLNLGIEEDTSPKTDLLDSQGPPIKYESGPESVSGLSLPYLADDEVSNWTPNSEPDAVFATSPDFDVNRNSSPQNGYKFFDDSYSWVSPQQPPPPPSQHSSQVLGS